jgi:hypothetical protein
MFKDHQTAENVECKKGLDLSNTYSQIHLTHRIQQISSYMYKQKQIC